VQVKFSSYSSGSSPYSCLQAPSSRDIALTFVDVWEIAEKFPAFVMYLGTTSESTSIHDNILLIFLLNFFALVRLLLQWDRTCKGRSTRQRSKLMDISVN